MKNSFEAIGEILGRIDVSPEQLLQAYIPQSVPHSYTENELIGQSTPIAPPEIYRKVRYWIVPAERGFNYCVEEIPDPQFPVVIRSTSRFELIEEAALEARNSIDEFIRSGWYDVMRQRREADR